MEMDGSLIMFLTVSFFFFQIKKIIVSLARRDLTDTDPDLMKTSQFIVSQHCLN